MISAKAIAAWSHRRRALRYGIAVGAVAVAAILRLWLEARYGVTLTYITLYPATMLAAVIGGLGPGILATALAGAFAAIFLLEPRGHFGIGSASDQIGLWVFVLMGLFISVLAEALHRTKRHERAKIEQALRESEDRFRMVVDGVEDYAIYMLDPQGRVTSWNTGAERIKGWSAQEILGENYARFFTGEAIQADRPRQQLLIAADEGCCREEAERVRKDGSRFWAEVTVTALRDNDGNLHGFAKVTRDVTERRSVARQAAESRSRLANVVESAMDAIIAIDSSQRIVLFNASAVTMFGCPARDALGRKLEQFIPQRFRAVHAQHVRDFGKTGVTSRTMGRLGTLSGLRRDGQEFPIEASISQSSLDGHDFFTVILRDITTRKRAEEHQSLLLSELAHRVKNTLAVVQSLAAQTRRFTAPDQFDDTFTARLAALGAVHDLLTRSEWAGASLADVVRFGFEPYSGLGAVERWSIDGPRVWLAPNEAVTLSLVFHELATNAAKFGALSNTGGRVTVGWSLEPEPAPDHVTIHWQEHDGPIIEIPSRRGFGSRLLERAITHELRGETTMQFAPSGLSCKLRLPLSRRISVAAA